MAKLTKPQLRLHKQCEELISLQRDLKFEEVDFVLDNWMPSAGDVTSGQAFFTPEHIAYGLAMCTYHDGHIIDMCAGIGRLSWEVLRHNLSNPDFLEVSAIENNPDFVRVGKKLMPQVNWVEGSIFEKSVWEQLSTASSFITNPPFSLEKIKGEKYLSLRSSGLFAVLEAGLRNTSEHAGTAILPKSAIPWGYKNGSIPHQLKMFMDAECVFKNGTHWTEEPFDTSIGEDGFIDTEIAVEIASMEII